MSRAPFVRKSEATEPLAVVGESIRVLAGVEDTGSYEVFLQSGPIGAGPPPHRHPWDEAYYVIDGQIDVLLVDRVVTVSRGEFVHIPAGTLHNFAMKTTDAKFLSLNSAGGASTFFREISRDVRDPSDFPKMMPIAERNRVAVELPPGMMR
jgi:quercetin dioxygenase-like cupin family protein